MKTINRREQHMLNPHLVSPERLCSLPVEATYSHLAIRRGRQGPQNTTTLGYVVT